MDIFEQLARDEGKKPSAYQDSLGYWTIGIGTCIDSRVGCGLTEAEIELLCSNRVQQAKKALADAFPWAAALDDARMGALVNMAYQMGIHRLSGFKKFLAALQAGDYAAAAKEMLDSLWAQEQSPARASRLSIQIQTGVWT
jgi:lysozyme